MKKSLRKSLGIFLILLPFIVLAIILGLVMGWGGLLILLGAIGIAIAMVVVLGLGLGLLEDDPNDQKTT
jgi:hypothetical protein